MTIHAPIDTRIAERQARIAERQEAQRKHLARMAKAATVWEWQSRSDWKKLAFLDALSFCIDSDLEREMDDLRHDLRIDAEGFPTNDEGDRIPNAERRYVPLKSLERNAA